MSAAAALAEWRRAQAALGATDSCRRDGYHADAVSRAYYAVLHAARATLQLDDIETETHAATRNTFGLYIVRAGYVEPQFGSFLRAMSESRADADYDVDRLFSAADADATYERANLFLDRIRTVLVSRIPEGELL